MARLTTDFLSKFTLDAILILVMAGYVPLGMRATPSIPEINLFDPDINHHFHNEQISDLKCITLAFVVPLIVMMIHFVIKRKNIKYSFVSVFGLVYSIVLTSFIILVLKNLIGKPRPDFVARCKPNWVRVEQLINQGDPKNLGKVIFFDLDVCTGVKEEIYEGLRSHPSGHSALSFAGLNYLSLWLLSNSGPQLMTHVLCFIPELLAIFVAFTRIHDYKHDYYDIGVGGFFGCLISFVLFNKMFKGNQITYLEAEEGNLLPVHNSD